MPQFQQEPEKPPLLTDEEWAEQLDEMRQNAKRLWRQSGGQLDVYPYPASREPSKQ